MAKLLVGATLANLVESQRDEDLDDLWA